MNYIKEYAASYIRGILALLFFCFLLGSYYNIRLVTEEEKWLKHSQQVTHHFSQIRVALTEAEIQATNYILTGENVYARKYLTEKNKVISEVSLVKKLIYTDVASLKLLYAGTAEISGTLRFSDQLLLTRQISSQQSTLLMKKRLDNRYRERAERYIQQLEIHENKINRTRTLASEKSSFIMNLSIIFTFVLFLSFLIILLQRARKIAFECSELVKELSRSAKDLENMNNKLQLQNEVLEHFTYMVSHDIRAPVANIIGLGNILEMMDEESDDKNAVLNQILLSVNKFDHMIRNLNDILQLENLSDLKSINALI